MNKLHYELPNKAYPERRSIDSETFCAEISIAIFKTNKNGSMGKSRYSLKTLEDHRKKKDE